MKCKKCKKNEAVVVIIGTPALYCMNCFIKVAQRMHKNHG